MTRTDNLLNDEFREFNRRLRALETASPLGFSSVTRGQFRIGGTAQFLVDATGGVVINGSCTGTGAWTWTGTSNLNGPWNLAGTGGITGAVSCTGNWTWSGNLTVNSPGKITFGAGTLSPTAAGGDPGLGSTASLGIQAATSLTISATSVLVFGQFSTSSMACSLTTSTATANVVCSSLTGVFTRTTSASRFKIDAQPMALSPELLEVPVKDWVDRGNAERFAAVYDSPRPLTVAQQLDFDGVELARIPGVIAEEVAAAAGGEAFITRGADGEIEGVSYDRFALARTQVLAQQVATTNERLDDALAQITELRDLLGAR